MSQLSRFLKENKKKRENTTYAASKSFVDEQGKPLEWILRPMTTEENDKIRDDCTIDVQVKGKPGQYREKLLTSKYIARMISACVVEPNLNDKDLQDSYGVMNAEDLIRQMIDDPAEYNDFALFIQNWNGFEPIDDDINEAKN